MPETAQSIRERLDFLARGKRQATWLILSPETWDAVADEGGAEADGQRAFDGVPVTLMEGAVGVAIGFGAEA